MFAVARDAVVGSFDKCKARLVCRGFTQQEGVDFDDTWAPTARLRIFRMMLAEASSNPSIGTAQWDSCAC